jgi:hypothetical protein
MQSSPTRTLLRLTPQFDNTDPPLPFTCRPVGLTLKEIADRQTEPGWFVVRKRVHGNATEHNQGRTVTASGLGNDRAFDVSRHRTRVGAAKRDYSNHALNPGVWGYWIDGRPSNSPPPRRLSRCGLASTSSGEAHRLKHSQPATSVGHEDGT